MTRSICNPIPAVALFAVFAFVIPATESRGQNNAELGPEIQLETLEGDSYSGHLNILTGSTLSVTLSGGQSQQWELTEISRLRFQGSARTSPPTRAVLRGGSEIAAAATSMQQDDLLIRSVGQPSLSVPIGKVRSVRFRAPASATDPNWLALVEEPQRRDRLVIRREGDALDPIEGTILEIKRDSVSFDLSGNIVDAPLNKLEGVIFSTSNNRESGKTLRVLDQWGSEWMAEQATWNSTAGSLELNLGDGITHSIPADQLLEIRLSGGILYLSDAEVAEQNQSESLNTIVGNDLASTWFATETQSKNLTTVLSSDHVVRVPEGYEKLVSAVRISPDVDQFTPLKVSVLLDDQMVWSLDLQDRKPHGLILPLEDARRLTLRIDQADVDSSESSPSLADALGHRVEWLGARLLK
ncbi:MAG: hypothetical protein ACF8AM_15025 [Rhodopirellula sp. JB055]|uniref:hypothetical protein n=1 Tax=Rhodopirellula sp. JB055 TaxID=3342846 RepID=UPI00370C3E6B